MDLLALGLLLGVFVAVILRQVSGRGPPIWGSFLAGATVAPLLGVVSFGQTGNAIQSALPILEFLIGMFVFTTALDRSGALEHLASWFLGRARRPAQIPFWIFLCFGSLSMILVNDALVLIAVPIMVSVGRRLDTDPRPLLLTVALAVTVGSAATPFGNPQNLLIALQSGLSAPLSDFLRYLLLPTILGLIAGGLLLQHLYRSDPALAAPGQAVDPFPRVPLFPRGSWARRIARSPVLILFPATLAIMVGSDLASGLFGVGTIPLPWIALVGALVLLSLSSGRLDLVRGIDVSILLLFVGLFIVVAVALHGDPFPSSGISLPIPSPSDPRSTILELVGTSLVGSQVVSNVPWVALQIPILASHGFGPGTPVAWMALAAGSTLAGNLTLLGAASNLLLVARAERHGVRIGLADFVRVGAPMTAITVTITVLCLLAHL
jgi:Na+/H+ antiporter NhaD/arsenite permease-like protein